MGRLSALCIAIFLAASVAAQTTGPAASADLPADPRGLLGTEVERRYEVDDYRDESGTRWIRLTSVFDTAYRAPLESVLAVLWDFRRFPERFSRIESVRVRSESADSAVIEQRTAVRVLGISHVTELTYLMELERPAAGAAILRFSSVEVDDSTRSSAGAWTLAEVADPSGPITVLRHAAETVVKPKYPSQAALMRRFGAKDLRHVLQEIGAALAVSP